MRSTRTSAWIWAFFALLWATGTWATPTTRTLNVDLNPLIDQAAQTREQFAVEVHHSASVLSDGTWSRQGAISQWTYRVRVPTAVSLSFRASGVLLPASATLVVSGARGSARYTSHDVNRNALLSRPLPGDAITITVTVSASEASLVRLQVSALQAGYRGLGGGVADHPHYLALRQAALSATSCTENYSCHATANNGATSHASVAIIVGNLYQCTGTLLNNARNDGTPYVLTARHCESGQAMGGNPDVASQVSVVWNVVSACGAVLGSIYDASTVFQTGATTVLEQQDAWLLRLDTPPAFTDAYFAGWDASGTPMTGGYTIHHALGESQQYVAWSGNAIFESIPGSTFNISFDSTFLGVVNGTGNLGAGASGSALFNPSDQVVGSASLAMLTAGGGSTGVCPVATPPAPSPDSVTALFTALSGIWNSTADQTSSTQNRTLKSFLDPDATGQSHIAGLPLQPLAIQASTTFASTGDTVTLSWSAPGATGCTAWGGEAGDGWSGVRAASGSVPIGNQRGGTVPYSLACVTGGGVMEGTTRVTWNYLAPLTNLTGAVSSPLVIGQQTSLNWLANVSPCTATGGVPGDGWAGAQPTSGSFISVVSQLGMSAHTLTCGSGPRTATNSIYTYGVSPQILIVADVPSINAGSDIWLSWFGNGIGTNVCTASGGSATDNWALFNPQVNMNGSTMLHEDNPGTYTYTLTCSAGGQTTVSSATVQVTADPPAIGLSAIAPVQQVYSLGPFYKAIQNLVWTSNVSGCAIRYTSNSGLGQVIVLSGGNPTGAVQVIETAPGPITYTLGCGSQNASATIDWVASSAPPILSATDSQWASNVAYPLSWNSPTGPCTASGGSASDGWAGSKSASGTQSVKESIPGTYIFTLACGSGNTATTSSVAVNVPFPMAQIYSTVAPGALSTLTQIVWTSTVGPCTYFDGTSTNPVGVPVPPSSSSIPVASSAGTYLFSISCGSGAGAIQLATLAQVTVDVPTTLTASTTSTTVNAPVILTWGSDGSGICYAASGTGFAPWVGTLPGTGSGTMTVTSRTTGAVTFVISCGLTVAQVTVTFNPVAPTSSITPIPSVTLSASPTSLVQNQAVALTWSSSNAASCTATGGTSGDGWLGSVALSGSKSITEVNPGSVTYSITCAGAPPAATSSATVVITASQSGSGGGGGGVMDLTSLLLLTGSMALRRSLSSRTRA